MTYAELRALIIDESHRPDLVARIPSFVDRAEGLIARDLRAVEMLKRIDLADANRLAVESPVYILPPDFLEERAVTFGERLLRKVARDGLLRMTGGGPPSVYTLRGNTPDAWVEFRGNPPLTTTVSIDYFARLPALTLDTDTNALLEKHESVYLYASLFSLYLWTQDTELAQGMLDTWSNAVERLNELAGRYFGGTGITPTLNVGHFPVGRGY